ncbi:MAG: heme-binding protein [Parachlamydiaceae bacterium]|nr:heme-binding protein [Parachlamydiaceae bacterium]
MSNVDQPKYNVITSNNNIELRYYEPMLLAEVEIAGERKEAITNGFKILADYIFGNNISKTKIKITAPVTSELNEKLAMTAPVMQQGSGGKWKVRFVMPAGYTIDTLPQPNSSYVKLISMPAKRFAVIRFSGLADEDSLHVHAEKLKAYTAEHHLKTIGNQILAFYNPPWTLPFLRRNEVMIEVE